MLSSSTKILEKMQLYNCAAKLKSDILYSKIMAIKENTEYTIIFFTEDNYYNIEKSIQDKEVFLKRIYLNNVVKEYLTTAKENELKFTSRGVTYTPCSLTLISNNYYVKLTVNLAAGRVKIDEIKKLSKKLLNTNIENFINLI